MNKRQKIALIKSVWRYLQTQTSRAFEDKNESDFDWYSGGLQAFWCALRDEPVTITPRVKPL